MLLGCVRLQSLENKACSTLPPHGADNIVYPDLFKAKYTNIHRRTVDIGVFLFLKLSKWLNFGLVWFLFDTENSSLLFAA